MLQLITESYFNELYCQQDVEVASRNEISVKIIQSHRSVLIVLTLEFPRTGTRFGLTVLGTPSVTETNFNTCDDCS